MLTHSQAAPPLEASLTVSYLRPPARLYRAVYFYTIPASLMEGNVELAPFHWQLLIVVSREEQVVGTAVISYWQLLIAVSREVQVVGTAVISFKSTNS